MPVFLLYYYPIVLRSSLDDSAGICHLLGLYNFLLLLLWPLL